MSVADRVAIVTGSARGIGAATAQRLAADGYAVAVLDLDESACAATVSAIEGAGGRALAVGVDVSDEEQVGAAVARVAAELGAPVTLVNNAGIIRYNLIFKMTAGDWPNHPVVVRLTGCPMITLPKLEDNDTSRICSDLELNKGQQPHELHHVVSIDESIALLQTSADLEWARSADQSRGMPGEWFTAAAGPAPRRIWCLLGVPYQDPAVRNRVLSVLTRPEPLPAEVAQETAEPASESEDTPASSDRWKSAQVASDEIEEGLSFGDGEPRDAPTVRVVAPSTPSRPAEAPVNTSPRINRGAATPDRGTFRGFAAVGSRIDDQDIKLLDDLRIDVIKCRAEELTRPFTAYAEFVREFTSQYNDAVSAALSGATNGTGQR